MTSLRQWYVGQALVQMEVVYYFTSQAGLYISSYYTHTVHAYFLISLIPLCLMTDFTTPGAIICYCKQTMHPFPIYPSCDCSSSKPASSLAC